ncbi:MAG: flagellar basal body-associated FliL family protein [Porticoccaceae bacterium]|nr:flagellar basal body-associated FliL family protein [Porticoccaceae bacterium]
MADNDGDAPKKRSILKIILIVVIVLVLLGGVAGGIMYAMGMFTEATDAEQAIAAMEANSADQEQPNQRVEKEYDAGRKPVYFEIKPELLSNVYNSQKVIQIRVALMFNDNDAGEVVEVIQEHNFPIRNALLKVLSEQREEMISRIRFREDLAFELKKEINDILEASIGSREIKELYFAELIVQ